MASAPALQRGWIVATAALLALFACGLIASAGGCYDFTFVAPAETRDAGDAGEVDACVVDLPYCGGDRVRGDTDTVYRCLADGGGALVKKCASGCVPDSGTGTGARCALPAAPCQLGGFYCGGDKLDGDPAVLYRCGTGGTAIEKERCAKGCQVAKSGTDDDCVR